MEQFTAECVVRHNFLRVKHGCNPLILSTKLSKSAQLWAEKVSDQPNLEHMCLLSVLRIFNRIREKKKISLNGVMY